MPVTQSKVLGKMWGLCNKLCCCLRFLWSLPCTHT